MGAWLAGVRWFRVRSLVVLVAVMAVGLGWGIRRHRRELADDSGQFCTHEEMVTVQEINEQCWRGEAEQAEGEATRGGPNVVRRRRGAATARATAEAYARARVDYEYRRDSKSKVW